ncbi:MAG: hypothetical protein N4A41_07770 [Crocinitomicaceae bacterium]|jgi:hypothetical protein|nr:hypothetical protein [Crocinitomicaceae bacterium]
MENNKKLIGTLAGLVLSAFTLNAQDINITVKGSRDVEKATRLTESPKIVDTVMPTPVVDYPRMQLNYQTAITVDTIEPAGVKIVDKLPQIYHSYAKIGIGTELMPLGEFYFNNTRSRKYKYGVHLQHLSSFGYMDNYAPSSFDRSKGRIYGGITEKKYDLMGELRYRNEGFQYYGFLNDSIARDSISQRFNDVGFAINFDGHKKDSGNLNYHVGIDYNRFNTLKPSVDSIQDWRTIEDYFAVKSGLWYKWGDDIFAMDFDVKYNGYQFGIPDTNLFVDTGIVNRNTVVSLRPTVTTYAYGNKLKAIVGFDFTIDANTKSKAYIYPLAEVKYSLFNDILIPYASITGGLQQNTFKSLSTINQFILPNVELRNEHKAIDFRAGIKGTISKNVGFNIGGSFAHLKNMALFVSDTLHAYRNQFTVIYDTLNRAQLEGSIYFQAKEKLKVDLMGRYNSYMLINNTYAWNMPTLEFGGRARYNLFNKVVTQLDVMFMSGRKALVYAQEPDTQLENNQYAKNLGLATDINLSIEYLYNNRISAFVQLNNAASQRYMRWYNYPVQPFQFMGGFTFKF